MFRLNLAIMLLFRILVFQESLKIGKSYHQKICFPKFSKVFLVKKWDIRKRTCVYERTMHMCQNFKSIS